MKDEIRILQSSSMGYGSVNERYLREGLKHNPDVIVGQGTSSDPGPAYFGDDDIYGYTGRLNKKRDTALILEAAYEGKIPFIFSGGSPAGSNPQLRGLLNIVNEICRERGIRFNIGVLKGELSKEYVARKLDEGARPRRIIETPRLPEYLTTAEVEESKRIVAQMGAEPVIKALQSGVDGVIAGRSLDVGLYMAYPMMHGFPLAVTAHMAKTIECGALCATPPMNENVFAILRRDHFLVFPLNEERRCTTSSVAAHAFYERADISQERNPHGYLDITRAQYEQYDERTVKAYGAEWVDQPYTIKLEGVKHTGYRSLSVIGIRDPNMVRELDGLLQRVRTKLDAKYADLAGSFEVEFHVYGKDAVLGPQEPLLPGNAHELGLVLSVVAPDQGTAMAIGAYTRSQIFFGDYPGRTSTSGNFASLMSPLEVAAGPVYTWNIWHALPLEDPCEPFEQETIEFPNATFVD